MAYVHCRTIVIDHTKVANSDQLNYPLLITGTFGYLATESNGGKVKNANGYDIIFTSDAAGTSRLDHDIDFYTPTTGACAFWVRIPSLSHTVDTTIYMWYGNPDVTTSQESRAGVWSDYVAVYHFGSAAALDLADHSANGFTQVSATGPISPSAGYIGGALSSGPSSLNEYTDTLITAAQPTGTQAFSLEVWLKMVASNDVYKIALSYGIQAWTGSSGSMVCIGQDRGSASGRNRMILELKDTNVGFDPPLADLGATWAAYHYVAISKPASANALSIVPYWDGVAKSVYQVTGSNVQVNIAGGNGSRYLSVGRNPANATGTWCGLIDEVRLRKTAVTADYVATQHANTYSPGTFYIVGDETATASPLRPVICIIT